MQDEPTPEAIQIFGAPDKLIPKFATKVGAAKADSIFVITFISELTGEQAQMVERVAIPEKLVDDLIKLIQDLKEK